jgi:hypothetical protein
LGVITINWVAASGTVGAEAGGESKLYIMATPFMEECNGVNNATDFFSCFEEYTESQKWF